MARQFRSMPSLPQQQHFCLDYGTSDYMHWTSPLMHYSAFHHLQLPFTADSLKTKNVSLHIMPSKECTRKLRRFIADREADLQQVHFLVGVGSGSLTVGSHSVTGLQTFGKADLQNLACGAHLCHHDLVACRTPCQAGNPTLHASTHCSHGTVRQLLFCPASDLRAM